MIELPGQAIINHGKSAQMNWQRPTTGVIYPIFLPFMGCSTRCVFCAQDKQTGIYAINRRKILEQLNLALSDLQARKNIGLPPCELAFYGGTFTALPDDLWDACLSLAYAARKQNLIHAFRCSTRPDALAQERLAEMIGAGCRLVELGVQSFAEKALTASNRHCNAQTCILACNAIIAAGLKLGVQLMPGIPGGTTQSFLNDVKLAIALGAGILRFYPCLVLENTALAKDLANNKYQPWPLKKALVACAQGKLIANAFACNVIRMGVLPQKDLERSIIAGPYHTDFGGRVLGLSVFLAVHALGKCAGLQAPLILSLPDFCQGYYRGWRGELARKWQNIAKIIWNKEAVLQLSAL